MFVSHPPYLRVKARELRGRGLTLDEITERLALPRGTVWSWIADLPVVERRGRANAGQAAGNAVVVERWRARREAAHAQGLAEFEELCRQPTFRDFVCLYVAEGLKRNRNRVAVGNSDASVIAVCHHWIAEFSVNPLTFAVQSHADQDVEGLQRFWSGVVGVAPGEIRLQRKSNSGRLAGRQWRSAHGVLTVTACDTVFRARLGGWMDRVRDTWA